MQGWVDLGGWLEMVYPHNGHPSWTNRAWCWLTSLMWPTTLTTTPSRHPFCASTVWDFWIWGSIWDLMNLQHILKILEAHKINKIYNKFWSVKQSLKARFFVDHVSNIMGISNFMNVILGIFILGIWQLKKAKENTVYIRFSSLFRLLC